MPRLGRARVDGGLRAPAWAVCAARVRRWVRIRSITAVCVMHATIRIAPWHVGHASGSTSKICWSSAAHRRPASVGASRGARTAKAREALEQQFLAPFDRRGRILAPSASAWRRAAFAGGAAPSASRLSDVLLACQAREFGWTIVRRDADFTAIRKSITGLKVAVPFPARP